MRAITEANRILRSLKLGFALVDMMTRKFSHNWNDKESGPRPRGRRMLRLQEQAFSSYSSRTCRTANRRRPAPHAFRNDRNLRSTPLRMRAAPTKGGE